MFFKDTVESQPLKYPVGIFGNTNEISVSVCMYKMLYTILLVLDSLTNVVGKAL